MFSIAFLLATFGNKLPNISVLACLAETNHRGLFTNTIWNVSWKRHTGPAAADDVVQQQSCELRSIFVRLSVAAERSGISHGPFEDLMLLHRIVARHLGQHVDDRVLRDHFQAFGELIEAHVIRVRLNV